MSSAKALKHEPKPIQANMGTPMGNDLHAEITEQIIDAIENNTANYSDAWLRMSALPVKAGTGDAYRGINILILWNATRKNGFISNEWAGFKGWKDKGATVRKGEKATRIIYYKTLTIEDDNGGEDKTIPMIKHLNVWNRSQVDGLPEVDIDLPVQSLGMGQATETMELIADNNNVNVVNQGARACYIPLSDTVQMPLKALFYEKDTISADVGYASTLAHELCHWTGHSSRLNRLTDGRIKANYSFEELVAELGSAFMCAQQGFEYSGVEDHAGYIQSWLKYLRNDNKAIFKAASLASNAVEYLLDDE